MPARRRMSRRIPSAACGLPRARSSITRSIIDTAKVTPAALMACRSIGAKSHGLPASRPVGGVLARISASVPMRSPDVRLRLPAGSPASHRSRMVGKLAVTSNTPSARIATTDGPSTSARQTRPASAPEKPSAGSVSIGLSVTVGSILANLHRVHQRRSMCRALWRNAPHPVRIATRAAVGGAAGNVSIKLRHAAAASSRLSPTAWWRTQSLSNVSQQVKERSRAAEDSAAHAVRGPQWPNLVFQQGRINICYPPYSDQRADIARSPRWANHVAFAMSASCPVHPEHSSDTSAR